MSNVLIKTMIGFQSEQQNGDLPRGSGTQSDPYNWYKILDTNNPNGCHTEYINQSADEGWIKVKLEANTTYIIGQSSHDEYSNSFDTYIRFYDSNFNELIGADGNDSGYGDIDGFNTLDAAFQFTPTETGYYYIKAGSYNDNYQNISTTVHCSPAPINENENSGGGNNIIEANQNCYIIEIEVSDINTPVNIEDMGPAYQRNKSNY